MNLLKSLFISLFMMVLMLVLAVSVWALISAGEKTWLGALIASAVPALFFIRLFLLPTARTSENLLWMPALGVAATLWSVVSGGWAAIVLSLLAGVVGPLIYIFWYSRFGQREQAHVRPSEPLPAFVLEDMAGQLVQSSTLLGQHGLWLFYRGNWCPFCMAQVKELAARYRELADKGVSIYLISPQPQDHSRELADHFKVPMQFFTDRDNAAARALGILAENGLPAGLQALGYDSDVPLPTVFITKAGGEVIYSDLTDNYRIRPEPDDFIQALTQAGI